MAKRIDCMNAVELMVQAHNLQSEFDNMSQNEYESYKGQKMLERQQKMCSRYFDLTGRDLFMFG